jgi:diaminopimelate decarboxylase
VGAYNVTQWMQFIEYRPAVVLVGEDGKVELIREREDLTDVERRERLPDRLRLTPDTVKRPPA